MSVRLRAAGIGAAAFLASVALVRGASAAPPWVDRHVVLPEHDWAFDVGFGVAHDYDPPPNPTGVGMNLEAAVSPVDRLEIGLRTGVRFGDDGRATVADAYGRLFDRQTFGTRNDVFADPEVRVRGALVRGRIAEVALEGRLFLPAEQFSQFGMMFGVPLLFHIAGVARIDTGVYAPLIFDSPLHGYFSFPFDLWFQPTDRFWLGPMTGVVFNTATNHADVPLGFGLGYQILRNLDLKSQILFPAINREQGAQTLGFGIGIQVRIE